jgi:hypothetical protein
VYFGITEEYYTDVYICKDIFQFHQMGANRNIILLSTSIVWNIIQDVFGMCMNVLKFKMSLLDGLTPEQ